MIIYEFTMDTDEKTITYLEAATGFSDQGSTHTNIKTWEAELAPLEYQNDFSEECRKKNVENGYSYCQNVGWVKLLNKLWESVEERNNFPHK